jgi:hypothetical protein
MTTRLQSFRKDYNLAVVCLVNDPSIDPLSDDRLTISNPFDITPGGINIVATNGRNLDKMSPGPIHSLNHFVILIPKNITLDKIATLDDVRKFGGKIVVPQYWE